MRIVNVAEVKTSIQVPRTPYLDTDNSATTSHIYLSIFLMPSFLTETSLLGVAMTEESPSFHVLALLLSTLNHDPPNSLVPILVHPTDPLCDVFH